jgi:ferredoxin
MVESFLSPAEAAFWIAPGWTLFLVTHLLGLACFAYIVVKRFAPILRAQRDDRFDRPLARSWRVLQFWLGQWRHPRYAGAGILHILLFAGFLILFSRAMSVLWLGVSGEPLPGLTGTAGHIYEIARDYATTVVFAVVVIAALRRIIVKPARYALPASYGRWRAFDAVFLLALIALLMAADAVFEGSKAAAYAQLGLPTDAIAALSLPAIFKSALMPVSVPALGYAYLGAYAAHELAFFFLLCYRPFGIQFHVETSLFAVYFSKLDREALKPVRWGVTESQLDQVKSFGVKTFEDFTWKHMLDFYTCADCGRCADQCPANSVGRPLSPRFVTTKGRDYAFEHYPVFGRSTGNGQPVVGNLYSEDEIWSCTTCGACEAECPLLI